jgi:hypothetical protein
VAGMVALIFKFSPFRWQFRRFRRIFAFSSKISSFSSKSSHFSSKISSFSPLFRIFRRNFFEKRSFFLHSNAFSAQLAFRGHTWSQGWVIMNLLISSHRPGLPDFSRYMRPKPEKCTKWTQNVPNGHKIFQISVKYSKWP